MANATIIPLLMVFQQFSLLVVHMPRSAETDEDFMALLLLLNLFLNFISNIRSPDAPLPLLTHLRPQDCTSHGWQDRNVFDILANHRDQFWFLTGETPETFNQLHGELLIDLTNQRRIRINLKNKLLLTLIWLRQYPTYALLSVVFNLSPAVVCRVIEETWIILWRKFSATIRWPTRNEWRGKYGVWSDMPRVLGVIDGTSHEILVPQDQQQLYFSGHRHYHCLHTQIIIDNSKNIRYVHAGFLGHQNDAQTFQDLPDIGPGKELDFPRNARLLADSIYPCKYPLITPYKSTSVVNQRLAERRRRRRYNRQLRSKRIYVEHVIKKIKTFKCISSVYRSERFYLPSLIELCAALSKRKCDFIATL